MTAREELNIGKKSLNIKTDEELAKKIGTNRRNIANWVKRDTIPDKWRMILSSMVSPNAKLILNNHTVELNYFPNVYASAGYGNNVEEINSQTITVTKLFMDSLAIKRIDKLDVIRIHGDSMEPDFSNGEYVIVDRVTSIDEIPNNSTIIANISGELYIKKLQKVPFESTIILNPTNNNYPPITLQDQNQNNLSIVGIVKGCLKPY